MLLLVSYISLSFFFSFCCSLFEAALLSLTPSQIEVISGRDRRVGLILANFKKHIDKPLAVILLINTTAHTVGATMAGSQLEHLGGRDYAILFSLLFTYLMLQFTEILPKTIGIRFNTALAPTIAMVLVALIRALNPFVSLVYFINKPFAGKKSSDSSNMTIEELSAMTGLARMSKLITPHQEKIIDGAIKLQNTNAGNVMILRDDITFLQAGKNLIDNFLTAHLDPHTRFPVTADGDPNKVIGYVNFKEMVFFLNTNPSAQGLQDIVRPVYFCNPSMPISDLLAIFIHNHEHMAIVRSEDQRILGLVTLEDIVEEIVGDIEDEYDRLPRKIHPIAGGIWLVGGGVPMPQLCEAIGAKLSHSGGSLATWMVSRLPHPPKINERYTIDGFEFYIRRMRRGQAFEIGVTASGNHEKLGSIMPPPPKPSPAKSS